MYINISKISLNICYFQQIINKDYHDDFKTLPNYNKNEIKFSGFDSPESDSKGQIINKLNNRIKELETRNNELEIICGKVIILHFLLFFCNVFSI